MESYARTDLLIWRWQRRAAVLLVPFLAFHVGYQYYVIGMDGISFDTVSAKLTAGVFVVLDLVLLALVAAHAFGGIRAILLDYSKSTRMARAITAGGIAVFAVTVAYAVVALFAFL